MCVCVLKSSAMATGLCGVESRWVALSWSSKLCVCVCFLLCCSLSVLKSCQVDPPQSTAMHCCDCTPSQWLTTYKWATVWSRDVLYGWGSNDKVLTNSLHWDAVECLRFWPHLQNKFLILKSFQVTFLATVPFCPHKLKYCLCNIIRFRFF